MVTREHRRYCMLKLDWCVAPFWWILFWWEFFSERNWNMVHLTLVWPTRTKLGVNRCRSSNYTPLLPAELWIGGRGSLLIGHVYLIFASLIYFLHHTFTFHIAFIHLYNCKSAFQYRGSLAIILILQTPDLAHYTSAGGRKTLIYVKYMCKGLLIFHSLHSRES